MKKENTQAPVLKRNSSKKHKMISYAKYGYLFLIPFVVIFLIFQFYPLLRTFYYSVFKYYVSNTDGHTVGPTFIGFQNFAKLLQPGSKMWQYLGNTMIIWILGFVPQCICSLLLAIWFTDERLKLKGIKFFQTVTYMPNLVMAAAFGYMFQMFFSSSGPVNLILESLHLLPEGTPIMFKNSVWWTRVIIAFINFLMWFGNTSILLMSGIMGIDESVFESARLDGASSWKIFWKITMPLLTPIFVYFFITSMIGGIQLFDAAQMFTQGKGGTQQCAKTIIMYLYDLVNSKQNYGEAGALSAILFVITGVLSLIVFKVMVPKDNAKKAEIKAKKKRERFVRAGLKELGEGNPAPASAMKE